MDVGDVAALQAVGEALGRTADAGVVVALIGDLGAGKTTFAQGFARGLGVVGEVVSPTFVLVSQHVTGRLPFAHCDLYRVEHPAELEELGLAELIDGDGAVLIEWADLHPDLLPVDHLRVELRHAGVGRTLRLVANGPTHLAWLGRAGVR